MLSDADWFEILGDNALVDVEPTEAGSPLPQVSKVDLADIVQDHSSHDVAAETINPEEPMNTFSDGFCPPVVSGSQLVQLTCTLNYIINKFKQREDYYKQELRKYNQLPLARHVSNPYSKPLAIVKNYGGRKIEYDEQIGLMLQIKTNIKRCLEKLSQKTLPTNLKSTYLKSVEDNHAMWKQCLSNLHDIYKDITQKINAVGKVAAKVDDSATSSINLAINLAPLAGSKRTVTNEELSQSKKNKIEH